MPPQALWNAQLASPPKLKSWARHVRPPQLEDSAPQRLRMPRDDVVELCGALGPRGTGDRRAAGEIELRLSSQDGAVAPSQVGQEAVNMCYVGALFLHTCTPSPASSRRDENFGTAQMCAPKMPPWVVAA